MTVSYRKRVFVNFVASLLMLMSTLIGIVFLLWITWTTLKYGVSALRLDLFLNDTPPPGTGSYGLRNAFVGSLILLALAFVVGVPVGLMCGTWLAEFGRGGRPAQIVRFVNDIMLAAPSIEIGLFTYAILVDPIGHFSAYAGGVALAILMIPIIVRTTDEMLNLVSPELREAAIALGTPQWKVITKITWKAAKTGIVTGILIAIARISGETAPLLFTALNNQFFSTDLAHPIANLPVVIFQFAMSPYANWQQMAWAGAFISVVFVMVLTVFARLLLARQYSRT